MQSFYTTEDFEIRSSGGWVGDRKPVMFIFVHVQEQADVMTFNVFKSKGDGSGSCLPHDKFSFPGKSATRAKVACFYRDRTYTWRVWHNSYYLCKAQMFPRKDQVLGDFQAKDENDLLAQISNLVNDPENYSFEKLKGEEQ